MAAVVAVLSSACTAVAGDDAALDADALPRLVLEEELRIGSVSDPDAGFSRIGEVDVAADGRVYVVESQDVQIRVYDSTGRLLHRIGRRGGGPGEFRRAPSIGLVGDTLWAYDAAARRLTLLTRDGALLSATAFPGLTIEIAPQVTGVILPRTMRGDGRLIGALSMVMAGSNSGANSTRVPRVLFDAAGNVLDTIGWQPFTLPGSARLEVGGRTYSLPQPPGDAPLETPVMGGALRIHRPFALDGRAATFDVVRTGDTGDTLFHRVFRYRPLPFPGELLDSLAWRAAGRTPVVRPDGISIRTPPESERRQAFNAIRAAMQFPAVQPPIRSNQLGADSSIWLKREVRADADHWIVLDAKGRPRGELILPAGTRIAWTGGDTVWVVETDEFDVPWLVRYRLAESDE